MKHQIMILAALVLSFASNAHATYEVKLTPGAAPVQIGDAMVSCSGPSAPANGPVKYCVCRDIGFQAMQFNYVLDYNVMDSKSGKQLSSQNLGWFNSQRSAEDARHKCTRTARQNPLCSTFRD